MIEKTNSSKIKVRSISKFVLTILVILLGISNNALSYTDTKTGSVQISGSLYLPGSSTQAEAYKKAWQTVYDANVNAYSQGGSGYGSAPGSEAEANATAYSGSWENAQAGLVLANAWSDNYAGNIGAKSFASAVTTYGGELLDLYFARFAYDECYDTCNHENKYTYTFDYEVNKDGQWVSLPSSTVNKCESLKVNFNSDSEWFGSLAPICSQGYEYASFSWGSPPTNSIECVNQDDCLSKATEYSLTSESKGKGVQQISSNFIDGVNKSLKSNNETLVKCENGICTTWVSGNVSLSSKVPQTAYFGQCTGHGVTIVPAGANIPEVTSNLDLNIQNRAPVASVTLSRDNISVGEEIEATCNIVDPDDCSDKIATVKWSCYNENNQKVDCFFNKEGVWKEGSTIRDIPTLEQSNPYQSKIKVKVAKEGGYAIVCEGTDNDPNNPLTGIGIAGLGTTITSTSNANDNGAIAAMTKYCAIISDEGSEKTVCDTNAKITYKAYTTLLNPGEYRWACSNETLTSGGATKECSYSSPGEYTPKLEVLDKKDNTWVECSPLASLKVNQEGSCKIKARKVGGEEYSTTLTANLGDRIEAKVERECLSDGSINWNASPLTALLSKEGNTINLELTESGNTTLGATIVKDGKTYDCGNVGLDIKTKVEFGQ